MLLRHQGGDQVYKPENVLINGAGASKLTDFGIAARAGDSPVPAGTMKYARRPSSGSPATPASDVYAATATFYECLTGPAAVTGDTAERLLYQHLSEPLLLEPVPGPLRPLVAAGLAKDPGARPADGAAVVAGLRAAAGGRVRAGLGGPWPAGRLAAAALLLVALWPSCGPDLPAPASPAPAHQHGQSSHYGRGRGGRHRPGRRRVALVHQPGGGYARPHGHVDRVIHLLPGPYGAQARRPGSSGRDAHGDLQLLCAARQSGVPSGEGTITGTYSATRTDIRPGRWIRQPPGYVLVGLAAGPPADNGTLLRGRVSNPGYSTFSVTKSLWLGFRVGEQIPPTSTERTRSWLESETVGFVLPFGFGVAGHHRPDIHTD